MSKLNKDKTRKTDLFDRIEKSFKNKTGIYLTNKDVIELYQSSESVKEILSDRKKDETIVKKLVRSRKLTNPPPQYVRLLSSELRLRVSRIGWQSEEGMDYYRDAGVWSVDFREKDGKLFSKSNAPNLNNVELIPITKEEWLEGNKGYV